MKHAEQAISFLEKRQQFWAKQKPVYTRQMERRRALGLLGPTSGGGRGKRRTSSVRPLGGRSSGCIDGARSARTADSAADAAADGTDSASSTGRASGGSDGANSPGVTDRSSSDAGGTSSEGLTDLTSSGIASATSAAD